MAERRTASPCGDNHRTAIWQGYQHAWEYNHRLNRFGSYVTQRARAKDGVQSVVGHTAASGTGNDSAHFAEFVTPLRSSGGVAFQSGWGETVVECQRGDLTAFVIKIDDLELDPALCGRDVAAVVLNGFDLCALEHAEKIITFDVDVTDPVIYAEGTRARFYIVGHLRFDCRSPECQLLPLRLEAETIGARTDEDAVEAAPPVLPPERRKRGIDRRRVDRAAHWLKRQLVTLMDVEEVKQSLLDRDTDSTRRRLFRFRRWHLFLRFLKWEISAPYRLRVHYLLVAGDRENLAVRDSDVFAHDYSWDLEREIRREQVGVLPVRMPADDVAGYDVNTMAFRHLSMDVTIDEQLGTEDPIQWGQGMHMLEWSMAIRDITARAGEVEAQLDLFYKNWSEAMNERITLTTWGSVRGAGSARISARLALLQMRDVATDGQHVLPGRIYWPGVGANPQGDIRARFERPLESDVQEP